MKSTFLEPPHSAECPPPRGLFHRYDNAFRTAKSRAPESFTLKKHWSIRINGIAFDGNAAAMAASFDATAVLGCFGNWGTSIFMMASTNSNNQLRVCRTECPSVQARSLRTAPKP